MIPIDGLLVREWGTEARHAHGGVQLGIRVYEIDGIRFARIRGGHHDHKNWGGLDFFAVDAKDYRKLYKTALRCRRDAEPRGEQPVLLAEQRDLLWRNTIGYLHPANLRRIRDYGGSARRGVLLVGPPGNGKTMACRWLWEECRRRGWEWRLVTPDSYRSARTAESVRDLFTLDRRGIIFFDDMDLALRDRDRTPDAEDLSVFLGALDGMVPGEGVVFVFTSNCPPELIDPGFRRPGRLDVVLHIRKPDAPLRRELVLGWHKDIRANVPLDVIVSSTDAFSFAEMEELKNLLIMQRMDAGTWDWQWALDQFQANRRDLNPNRRQRRRVGFVQTEVRLNGVYNGV